MFTLNQFEHWLRQSPKETRLVIAFSGGLDSTVLLHYLTHHKHLRPKIRGVVYVNHGLQPEATNWQHHCQQQCTRWQVPLHCGNLHLSGSHNIEGRARQQRYQILAGYLQPNDILLTGHHQQDLAETVLLNLCRGSSVDGLAAMPFARRFGHGWLVRPLLHLSKQQLLAYGQQHQLSWQEDPSNQDNYWRRNALRQQVLPTLRQYWPQAEQKIAQTSHHCADYRDHAQQLARHHLAQLLSPDQSLDWPALAVLPKTVRCLVLRLWFSRQGAPVPSEHGLYFLWQQLQAQGQWRKGQWQVQRFQQSVYLFQRASPMDNQRQWPMAQGEPIFIAGIGQLQLIASPGGLKLSPEQSLCIRLRQGGEYFHPQNRPHRQRLKKLLQEKACPPWERARLPLLYASDQLLAVPYVGLARYHTVPVQQLGWRLLWTRQF